MENGLNILTNTRTLDNGREVVTITYDEENQERLGFVWIKKQIMDYLEEDTELYSQYKLDESEGFYCMATADTIESLVKDNMDRIMCGGNDLIIEINKIIGSVSRVNYYSGISNPDNYADLEANKKAILDFCDDYSEFAPINKRQYENLTIVIQNEVDTVLDHFKHIRLSRKITKGVVTRMVHDKIHQKFNITSSVDISKNIYNEVLTLVRNSTLKIAFELVSCRETSNLSLKEVL